jgi:hypothetical protein
MASISFERARGATTFSPHYLPAGKRRRSSRDSSSFTILHATWQRTAWRANHTSSDTRYSSWTICTTSVTSAVALRSKSARTLVQGRYASRNLQRQLQRCGERKRRYCPPQSERTIYGTVLLYAAHTHHRCGTPKSRAHQAAANSRRLQYRHSTVYSYTSNRSIAFSTSHHS